MNPQSKYIYLDTPEDRQHLITEIARARAAVQGLVEIVPEKDWYTPRYHGWSLAAMLAHLNMVDSIALLMLRLALLGIHPRLPLSAVHWVNDRAARVYRTRLVPTSLRDMQKNQARISTFIEHLPITQFSKTVQHPVIGPLTVERAIQEFFLYHWHAHLATMHAVEGIGESSETGGPDNG